MDKEKNREGYFCAYLKFSGSQKRKVPHTQKIILIIEK